MKADEGSYIGSSHIEYEIEITRAIDSESHSIIRRFREIRDFYDTLLKQGLITNDQGLLFPSKSVFEGTVDPNSAFVQKRRIELQVSSIYNNIIIIRKYHIILFLEFFSASFRSKSIII